MIENWNQYKDLEYYSDRVCKCECGGRIKVQKHHRYYGIPEYLRGHNSERVDDWVENWDKYKDCGYYPDRFCACGCGGRIKVQSYHKYGGIPDYIRGHCNRKLREVRSCACGCKETFECIITSKQRYINGHHRRGIHIPRETRLCACGCGRIFECKVNSKQRYITGHNRRGAHPTRPDMRGDKNPAKRPEVREKLRKNNSMKNPKYRKKFEEGIKRRRSNPNWQRSILFQDRAPTKPEEQLNELLQLLFSNEWGYVGDGSFWITINGKHLNPDFINTNGQKKIIEMNGDWWHSEKIAGRTKEEEEQQRIDLFAQFGYQTLIIWEHELQNLKKVAKKILEFTIIE